MKFVTVDIDKLDDFLRLARLAGAVVFVNVQNEMLDTLFFLQATSYPLVIQCAVGEGAWRGETGDMVVIEATLEG